MHLTTLFLIPTLFSSTLAAPAANAPQKRTNKLRFVGINESGAEWNSTVIPGVYGTDYTWYDLTSIGDFIVQGVNTFRVNFLMERLVPDVLTGPMDPLYLGNLTEDVSYITQNGAYAIITPHNYGRYYGEIINSTSDFQAFWTTVAGAFQNNSLVMFDTNNEYYGMAGQLVADLNQAAIDGVRAAGATTQYVTVEGNAWTGAWTWTTAEGTDGLTNAETMGNLTDPEDKILYQMHQYLDSDGSGTSETCVNNTIFSSRLADATEWLRANGKLGLIGEYAGGVNVVCEEAVEDGLSYLNDNDDVWTGSVWWAAGPWWSDWYLFSIEQNGGIAYLIYDPIILLYGYL